MESYSREPGKLLSVSGEEIAKGVADFEVATPSDGKLKSWSGTFSIGGGAVGFDIAKAGLC